MLINVITLEKIIYKGEADGLNAPGAVGQLSILPNHAPLITLLKSGVLKWRKEGQEECFEIERGILEVNPKEVNVLVTPSKSGL